MPTPEEEYNGVPPIDENGVDLSLIWDCLSWTPEQRLLTAQAAANQAMMFRRAGGFTDHDPWRMFGKIDYLGLLQRLTENQVEFVVIGGVAANLLGSPQITYDLDVCAPMSEQNISRIVAALRGVHPRFRFHLKKMPLPEDPAELHGFKNLNLDTDLGIIDLLGELPNICSFEDLAGKTTIMEVRGMKFRVLDLDTLLAAKKSAGRMKDLGNICQLEAIKRMQQQQSGLFEPPEAGKP